MPSPPTVVDLFSGAGGFSLGFQAAGCRIDAAIDADEAAGATFLANFRRIQPGAAPRVFSGDEGDLIDVDLAQVVRERPTIVIGGPPCQGFSRLGRAKLNDLYDEGYAGDARNLLYRRFLDAVKIWQPDAVVMENVPGMLSVEGRSVADEVAADLVACGYRAGYGLLNAVWYGVPQFRERLIFIGFRRDLGLAPRLPAATHRARLPSGHMNPSDEITLWLGFDDIHHELEVFSGEARWDAVTVAEALGDLPALMDHQDGSLLPKGDFRRRSRYSAPPRNSYAALMRNWACLPQPRILLDHVVRRTPRDYGTFARMKPGDRYAEAIVIARQRLDEALAREGSAAPHPGTPAYAEFERRYVPPYPEHMFKDKWRKLIPDQPSWTVPAHLSKDAYSHIHYDDAQARAISVREAARLQSFPDAFRFSGNMGDCFRQIGNAVPPIMAWAVAKTVLQALGLPWREIPWEAMPTAGSAIPATQRVSA